jgi:hypothetical protein
LTIVQKILDNLFALFAVVVVTVLFTAFIYNRAGELFCHLPFAPDDSVATLSKEEAALESYVVSLQGRGEYVTARGDEATVTYEDRRYVRHDDRISERWREIYAHYHGGTRRCVAVIYTSLRNITIQRVGGWWQIPVPWRP